MTSYFCLFWYFFRSLKLLYKMCRYWFKRAITYMIVSASEKEYLPSVWYYDANIWMVYVQIGNISACTIIYIFYTFDQVIKWYRTSHIVSWIHSNDGNLEALNSHFSVTLFSLCFYSHTSCAQDNKGNLKACYTCPEVTQLVEVCQLDPG